MNRFTPTPTSQPPEACDPADACTSWEWLSEVVAPLGWTCVVVEIEGHFPQFSVLALEGLNKRLDEAGLGELDSIKQGPIDRFFFNCTTSRLAEALHFLSTELRSLEVLPPAKIGYADVPARLWRTFVPPKP
jgi:hypothetical protein